MIILTLKKKHRIDENELARAIAIREGKKEQVNIAQIKEVLKIALDILGEEFEGNPKGVIELLRRHYHGD